MKTKLLFFFIVLTIFNFHKKLSAQGELDLDLVGTFGGVFEGFTVPLTIAGLQTGTPTLDVVGGLFRFSVEFNTLGFHEGFIQEGVLFEGGRKYPFVGNVLSVPIPNTRNKDIIGSFEPILLRKQSLDPKLEIIIEMQPAKEEAVLGRGTVDYVGTLSGLVEYNAEDGAPDPDIEPFPAGGETIRVEAKKESAIPNLFGFSTVKIYR